MEQIDNRSPYSHEKANEIRILFEQDLLGKAFVPSNISMGSITAILVLPFSRKENLAKQFIYDMKANHSSLLTYDDPKDEYDVIVVSHDGEIDEGMFMDIREYVERFNYPLNGLEL